ncbi:unnamed protein product [Symbiodinium microadriaticum]|nr:unnamed protein product [Symbiodinium sp. KB8]CAE7839541.1 unnamed protein product [Symbiodinium microadriaticum]
MPCTTMSWNTMTPYPMAWTPTPGLTRAFINMPQAVPMSHSPPGTSNDAEAVIRNIRLFQLMEPEQVTSPPSTSVNVLQSESVGSVAEDPPAMGTGVEDDDDSEVVSHFEKQVSTRQADLGGPCVSPDPGDVGGMVEDAVSRLRLQVRAWQADATATFRPGWMETCRWFEGGGCGVILCLAFSLPCPSDGSSSPRTS